jgi:hypothetical protein
VLYFIIDLCFRILFGYYIPIIEVFFIP